MLDNARRSHRKKFNETVYFYLDSMNLEERVHKLRYKKSETAYNEVDKILTYIFKKARSLVEGPMRTIPFSKKKLQKNNTLLYWSV